MVVGKKNAQYMKSDYDFENVVFYTENEQYKIKEGKKSSNWPICILNGQFAKIGQFVRTIHTNWPFRRIGQFGLTDPPL